MAGKTRTAIKATPILEAVTELPAVQRVAAASVYEGIVSSIVEAGKPGQWFKVFQALPTSSAANTRAGNIKGYVDMEATSRSTGENSFDVYARHAPEDVLAREAKAAKKEAK